MHPLSFTRRLITRVLRLAHSIAVPIDIFLFWGFFLSPLLFPIFFRCAVFRSRPTGFTKTTSWTHLIAAWKACASRTSRWRYGFVVPVRACVLFFIVCGWKWKCFPNVQLVWFGGLKMGIQGPSSSLSHTSVYSFIHPLCLCFLLSQPALTAPGPHPACRRNAPPPHHDSAFTIIALQVQRPAEAPAAQVWSDVRGVVDVQTLDSHVWVHLAERTAHPHGFGLQLASESCTHVLHMRCLQDNPFCTHVKAHFTLGHSFVLSFGTLSLFFFRSHVCCTRASHFASLLYSSLDTL